MKKRFWQLAAVGIVAAGALVPATVAYAADDYPVGSNTHTRVVDPGSTGSAVQVAGKTQTRGDLPFTGGDIAAAVAIGGGAVAIGGVLVVQSRKRRTLDAA